MMRWLLRLLLAGVLLTLLLGAAGAGVVAWYVMPELERWEPKVLALRDRTGTGPGWQFHSRVYSEALVLVPDLPVTEDMLLEELAARTYTPFILEKKGKQARRDATSAPKDAPDGAPRAESSAQAGVTGARSLPAAPLSPGQFRKVKDGLEIHLRGFDLPGFSGATGQVRVVLADGRIKNVYPLSGTAPLQTFALEPILLAELLGDPPRRATFIPLEQIPKHVQQAIIASEDARFYEHFGVDLRGVLRAVTRNIMAGGLRQGGSTITQQLARTLFLSTERTVQRKVSELALALLLDKHLKKERLLELYLNSVYLGQLEGVAIHGVEEAARAYFSKGVLELTEAEAATLTGIIPAPNAFTPLKYPERALEKRARVLGLMQEQGYLSAQGYADALAEPLRVQAGKAAPFRYGYYTSYVRHFLQQTLGAGFEMRGLAIYSSLDPALQTRVEKSLVKEVDEMGRRFGKQPEPLQGAAFLLDYHTGKVLAVVGGHGYAENPFNRAFQSKRQPGSSFKPIAYAAALEGGEGMTPFTPGTTLPDERRAFQVKEGDWRPRNYDGDYHPSVTLAKALTKSLNVATVNLVDQIGPQRVADLARRLGLGELKPVLSIGLGTNEVTLEQLVRAYSTFPSGGFEVLPQPVGRVVDQWEQTVWETAVPSKRLIKLETAQLMVELLRSVVIYGTSWTLRTEGYYPRPSAGKTGTSQDEQDAWYMGFTPELLLGVWVGYDTPRHLYGSAADVAVPVWGGVMTSVMQDRKTGDFALPGTMEYVFLDPYSGGRATALCPRPMRVAFLKGTGPTKSCPQSHEDETPEPEGGGEGSGEDEGAAPAAGVVIPPQGNQ